MYTRRIYRWVNFCVLVDTTKRGHFRESNHKQHPLAIVACHLLDLDLIEDARAINEILFGVALEHLIPEGI